MKKTFFYVVGNNVNYYNYYRFGMKISQKTKNQDKHGGQ